MRYLSNLKKFFVKKGILFRPDLSFPDMPAEFYSFSKDSINKHVFSTDSDFRSAEQLMETTASGHSLSMVKDPRYDAGALPLLVVDDEDYNKLEDYHDSFAAESEEGEAFNLESSWRALFGKKRAHICLDFPDVGISTVFDLQKPEDLESFTLILLTGSLIIQEQQTFVSLVQGDDDGSYPAFTVNVESDWLDDLEDVLNEMITFKLRPFRKRAKS